MTIVVRVPGGTVTHADAEFITGDDNGVLQLFDDQLASVARYEPGHWHSAIHRDALADQGDTNR